MEFVKKLILLLLDQVNAINKPNIHSHTILLNKNALNVQLQQLIRQITLQMIQIIPQIAINI